MHFQKSNQYQNQIQTQNFLSQNYQNRYPRQNRYDREFIYKKESESDRNLFSNREISEFEQRRMEISNEEPSPQDINKSRSLIRTIKDDVNEMYTPSQLVGDRNLSYALHNFQTGFNEERDPSPKTINVGDTKETIEYNIKTINARRGPRFKEQFYPNQEMKYIEPYDNDMRNGSFDGRRNQWHNMTYYEASPNFMINRYNDNNTSYNFDRQALNFGNTYNGPPPGGRISLRNQSPYQNFEEMNSSNDYDRGGSEERKVINMRRNFEKPQEFYGNVNMLPNQAMNMNDPNNMNNLQNYNNNMNMNNQNMNMSNKYVNMTHIPVNNVVLPPDDIQEKYINKTYDNMTYKDVKRIVRRFTKVYDPSKNSNGLLVEESQITLPGANDEVFNNRYKVLTKMKKLSNLLLSKQKKTSPTKPEHDYLFNFDETSSGDEFNIRTHKSFNRRSFEKRAKSPLKLPNRRSPENKFKYVSLAMISSKGLRTENRIILRKMRLEKGGVVDLAQENKKKGKYKISKVSRSPGYKKNFYRTNPKYRIRAAKYIQEWWRAKKEYFSKKLKKIIKLQSVYRGRFVRKYLYDLLYLNYLYLSFCQKIEKVLKEKIKPYVFEILKNYGKKHESPDDIKDFKILRNLVASKAKKWKILNLRRCINKWKRLLRNKEKLTLLIYKIIKSRIEKQNRKSVLKDAIRKWNYIVNTENMKKNFEEEKEILIEELKKRYSKTKEIDRLKKLIEEKDAVTKKIKGLFKIVDGINKYSKKSALIPTMPKIIHYLSKEYLIQLLKNIINRKIKDEKEILREYFFKYIKMTLKYIKNKINELPIKVKEEKIRLEIKAKKKLLKDKGIETDLDYKDEEEIDDLKKLLKELEEKQKNQELNMKARMLLHLVENVNNKQNKNILGKYFKIYFKKIIKLQREEDRKNFEEQQRIEKEKRDKERKEERKKKRKKKKKRFRKGIK